MKTSAIGWADFSGGDLNFVTGCTPVSESCENCYARAIYNRFGRDFSKVTWHEDKWLRAMRMPFPMAGNKRGGFSRAICFVCDTGDLFHEAVPTEKIIWALEAMRYHDDSVDWVILTKRPERMREIVSGLRFSLLSHIWLGVTAENQARADERRPILLDTPAAVRFVSFEPLLGPVRADLRGISWAVVGGESGPHRRPFDVRWAVALYEQCKNAGVPFFGKQGSGLRPGTSLLINGQEIHEWPAC